MRLTDRKAWKILRKHAVKTGNLHLAQLFADDDNRFNNFSLRESNLLFDYSKQRVNSETIELLCRLAHECDLSAWIEKLFNGDKVNTSTSYDGSLIHIRVDSDWLASASYPVTIDPLLTRNCSRRGDNYPDMVG